MWEFDKTYTLNFLKDILETDSPSGFTHNVLAKIKEYAQSLGYDLCVSNKGTGEITITGNTEKTIALCAHVDTLGLMVRSVRSDGTLRLTRIGSPIIASLEAQYCKIYTREGKIYTGTILPDSTSSHVYADAQTLDRDLEHMHVRLDEIVKSKKDTIQLGIEVGSYVCIETKTIITEKGFIKSRFLDDKLSVAALFGVLKYLKDNHLTPKHTIKILISSYEEVGHGMAFIPSGISELVAVDMGCIGQDLTCTEQDVSICVKDSSGPYDYELTNRLIALAKKNNISYAIDVYPFYSSDASCALKAGHDVKCALMGPGVAASHGLERSHYNGLHNTMKLIAAYIL